MGEVSGPMRNMGTASCTFLDEKVEYVVGSNRFVAESRGKDKKIYMLLENMDSTTAQTDYSRLIQYGNTGV